MHMRRLGGILAVVLLGFASAVPANARSPIAPDGVTYVPASASANGIAQQELKAVFSGTGNELSELVSAGVARHGKVLLGVFLAMAFANSDGFVPEALTEGDEKLPLGDKDNTIIHARILAVTRQEQVRKFESLFYGLYRPTARISVRRLTKDEMALVWFYIGWNLSEPVYVVKSGGHKLVFQFDPGGKSLVWIEDITSPCFRIKVGADELPCMCTEIVHKGNHYEPVFRPKKECPIAGEGPAAKSR